MQNLGHLLLITKGLLHEGSNLPGEGFD